MRVAKSGPGSERNSVSKLVDHLILARPRASGESITKFSDGQPTPWVEIDAWFVDTDGTPTPIGAGRDTSVRIWSEVLVPELAGLIGETVAARIIRPNSAYIFDDVTDTERARCEKAELALGSYDDSF